MDEPPGERALTILAAGLRTPAPRNALAALTIGERDRLLLHLRRELFGSVIDAVVTCSGCSEEVDLQFEVDAIVIPASDTAPRATDIEIESRALTVRVPTAGDVAAAHVQGDADASLRILLDRIVTSGTVAEDLEPGLIDQISAAIVAADPQAEVVLGASCPVCGRDVSEPLDVAAFVWTEIGTWAARLLAEVHLLARAYGWRELDILALSPLRRRFYLEAVGA